MSASNKVQMSISGPYSEAVVSMSVVLMSTRVLDRLDVSALDSEKLNGAGLMG
jgi:hypothetical protein